MIEARGLAKDFILHLQGGVRIPVLNGLRLQVHAGECVVLSGPSGAGKSTLMRALYGTYRLNAGSILIRHQGEMHDLTQSDERTIIEIRRETIGYVSQFLRAVPRVGALDLVTEAAVAYGIAADEATERAHALLARLNIPRRLHALPPATFSGGEQQRVNLARGFIAPRPVLLLDEPTASLDAANRRVVIGLVREAKARGAAIVGIFHDEEVRDAIADRLFPLEPLQDAA
jgi:alpha-D-ribose 1-methylphosphonate 5-triphosphate synthase subunit PhnL